MPCGVNAIAVGSVFMNQLAIVLIKLKRRWGQRIALMIVVHPMLQGDHQDTYPLKPPGNNVICPREELDGE